MKIIKTENFEGTMNLPKKTILVDGDLVRRQSYFLEKIRDDSKYKKAILIHGSSSKKYRLANFPVNIGEVLDPTIVFNQILKDIYIRYEFLNGNIVDDNITFVDKGIDNKENDVNDEKKDNKIDKKKIKENIKAKQLEKSKVVNTLKKQINEINNLGTILNYNEHYNSTTDGNIESIIIDKFLDLYNQNRVYRSFRPIQWCTNCKVHIDKSNVKYKKEEIDNYYVLYNVKSDKENVLGVDNLKNVYFIANTILPWTMVSSEWIAVCKGIEYSLVQVLEKDEKIYYIIISDMVEKFMAYNFYIKYVVIKTFTSDDLVNIQCFNPLNYNKTVYVIASSKNNIIIDKDNTSGIRIVSSGHSYLDYLIHKEVNKYKLKCVVNTDGTTNSLSLVYNNMNYNEVGKKVIEFLGNNNFIFYHDKINTAIAYCKKCNEKLLYRSISEWYLKKNDKISDSQYNMLISKMSSSNKYKEEEFKSQVEKINNIDEIVISDKKEIGIPIPVFYCAECGHEIVGNKINEIVGKIFREKGSEFWYKSTPEQILQGQIGCQNCGGTFLFKDDGSLNEYFKDLSIPFLLNQDEFNGSICIECKERFYNKLSQMSFTGEIDSTFGVLSKMMIHQAVEEKMKKVLKKTEEVKKENNRIKKKYNLEIAEENDLNSDIAIKKVIQNYGTDIFRLWVLSKSNDNNITLNDQYMINTKKTYMNIRRTLKFMLSNLTDFNPNKNYIEVEKRYDIDKIMYVKLIDLNKEIRENYSMLNLKKVYDLIIKFCVKNLCNEYFESIKYRLYVLRENDSLRRSVQSTLYDILMSLVIFLEPIIPLTLEEIWPYIWHSTDEEANNLLVYRKNLEYKQINIEDDLKKWERIYKLKTNTKKYISMAKLDGKIHHKLEATLIVNVNNNEAKEFIEKNYEDIRATLGISKIEVNISDEQGFEIVKTEGAQCRRCRQYSNYIGQNLKYTYLCPKCADILES